MIERLANLVQSAGETAFAVVKTDLALRAAIRDGASPEPVALEVAKAMSWGKLLRSPNGSDYTEVG